MKLLKNLNFNVKKVIIKTNLYLAKMATAANMGTAAADKMGNNVNIGTAATNMGTVASATMATSAANDRQLFKKRKITVLLLLV